jgi:hypothetical protein
MSASRGGITPGFRQTIGHDGDRVGSDEAALRANNAGLAISLIDGDHITLEALVALHESEAVGHRLRTLIGAGVRHMSIDLRYVNEICPSVAACLNDVALCLSEVGGSLELLNVDADVAAALEPSDDDRNRPGVDQRSGGGTNR